MTCAASKKDGSPCTLPSTGPDGLCWVHTASNADARRRGQSRGGRGRPGRELADVKQRLRELAEQVLAGRVDRADAAVAGQLYNTYLRAVAVEAKVKETEELEERLVELENARPANGRVRSPWG